MAVQPAGNREKSSSALPAMAAGGIGGYIVGGAVIGQDATAKYLADEEKLPFLKKGGEKFDKFVKKADLPMESQLAVGGIKRNLESYKNVGQDVESTLGELFPGELTDITPEKYFKHVIAGDTTKPIVDYAATQGIMDINQASLSDIKAKVKPEEFKAQNITEIEKTISELEPQIKTLTDELSKVNDAAKQAELDKLTRKLKGHEIDLNLNKKALSAYEEQLKFLSTVGDGKLTKEAAKNNLTNMLKSRFAQGVEENVGILNKGKSKLKMFSIKNGIIFATIVAILFGIANKILSSGNKNREKAA